MGTDSQWPDTDLYATLGVPTDAPASEIATAYRRLARRFHPDSNPSPDARERFADVSIAYDVLRDPGKRAQYDAARQRRAGGARRRPDGGYSIRVNVHEQPQPVSRPKGDDLALTVPITFAEAMLGADISVPTAGGRRVRLRIPPGTPPGQVFRLRGHGVPRSHERGDLLVTVQVHVPRQVSTDQREALERLAAFDDPDALRAHLREPG